MKEVKDEVMAMEEKRCARCGQVKPLSEFHKDGKRKDGTQGYRPECKDRECQEANLEASREASRNYAARWRAKAKAEGTCGEPGCREPAAWEGAFYCEEHLERYNGYNRERYQRRTATGRCYTCGEPAWNGGTRCWPCAQLKRMSAAVWEILSSRGFTKGGASWVETVDYTKAELLAHLKRWLEVQGINGEATEIHHIWQVAWFRERWQEPGDRAWRKLWALENLIPVTKEDHQAIHRGDLDAVHPAVRSTILEAGVDPQWYADGEPDDLDW